MLKKDHQPTQLQKMLQKQALALERRQDTKSLGYDIIKEALHSVDNLLLDNSLLPTEGTQTSDQHNSP